MKPLLTGLQAASSYLLSYCILVALFIFIFALAGRQLFGGKVRISPPISMMTFHGLPWPFIAGHGLPWRLR